MLWPCCYSVASGMIWDVLYMNLYCAYVFMAAPRSAALASAPPCCLMPEHQGLQVAKPGAKTKHLQDALGAWGREGANNPGKTTSGASPRIAAHGRIAGAVEACESPGRSSNASPSEVDTGIVLSVFLPSMFYEVLTNACKCVQEHSAAFWYESYGCQAGKLFTAGRSGLEQSVHQAAQKHEQLQKENAVLREEVERLSAQQGMLYLLLYGPQRGQAYVMSNTTYIFCRLSWAC